MAITITRNVGMILLAIYLILVGVAFFTGMPGILLALLAIGAGVCILIGV